MNSGKHTGRWAEKQEEKKPTTEQWEGTTATKQIKSSGKWFGVSSSEQMDTCLKFYILKNPYCAWKANQII